jgi:DNA topoisomerase IA
MMPGMPATQKEWIKRLQDAGWILDRGGKHQVKMTKLGQRPITLPENKRRAYSKGFEAQLRREAGL